MNSEERIFHNFAHDIKEQGDSSSVNIMNEYVEEEFSSTSGEINSLDLENGSTVMYVHPSMRDDGNNGDDDETVDENEKKNDYDDKKEDYDRKSIFEKKRLFQSNQIFLELGPKLEQRRYMIEDTTDIE